MLSQVSQLHLNDDMVFKLVLLAVGTGALVYYRRRLARAADPSCGACGYSVRGLKANRCPECGGDFKIVGVTGPDDLHPIGVVGWCVIWTFFFWLGVGIVMPIAEPFRPTVRESLIDGHIGQPSSGRYSGIQFEFTERLWSNKGASRTLSLEIEHTNGTRSGLTRFVRNGSSFTVAENTADPGALQGTTPQDVLDWMKRHGIPVAKGTVWPDVVGDPMSLSQDEAVLAEVQAVAETIKRFMNGVTDIDLGQSFRGGGQGFEGSHGLAYQLEVHILGWIVWIGGCLVIILIRWKRHRAAMNLT